MATDYADPLLSPRREPRPRLSPCSCPGASLVMFLRSQSFSHDLLGKSITAFYITNTTSQINYRYLRPAELFQIVHRFLVINLGSLLTVPDLIWKYDLLALLGTKLIRNLASGSKW